MADLSNPLTQVVVAQAQPAVTVNNLVDALSPAAIFGQNDLTTSGLTWGYYGGRYRGIAIAHGTLALPASQASIYIVAAKATGVVSQSTVITNWNDATNYDRLYLATTGSSTITDWDDYREVVSSAGAGVATIDTEEVQDIVGALLTAGSNVTLQYNDGDSPPTLVITATSGGGVWGSITGTLSNQSDLVNELNGKVSSSTFEELVQDICANLITAGSNITKQYNDGDSPATLVLSSTGGGGGTPGGADTNVQYNNASAFGGSAKFTWNDTTRTLGVSNGTDATASIIETPAQATAATAGAALTVKTGTGNTTGAGGALTLSAGAGGSSSGNGGAVAITAGGGTTTNGNGGAIQLTCGAGQGTGGGGSITLSGGSSVSNNSGAITLTTGASSGSTGGNLNLTVASSNSSGALTLQGGTSSQAGLSGGHIQIRTGVPGSGGAVSQCRWETATGAARLMSLWADGKFQVGPTTSAPTCVSRFEGSYATTATAVTATSTTTLNLATTNVHKVAMNANITTLTVSNPTDTQEVTIIFTQDGTGSRTIAWPASFKWPAGTVPTLSTPANSIDMYTGIYNSTTTSYLGRLEKAFA